MDLEDVKREYQVNGRISRRSIGILKELIRGDDPYSAITVAGDCAAFDASPEIGLCLDSEDSMVRWNAAGVLFTRFRQPDLGDRCLELAKSDPDTLVRAIALCGIGEILHKVTNFQLRAQMATTLLQSLNDASELPEFRGAAYEGILAAMDVLPLDRPSASRLFDPDKDLDEEIVQDFRIVFVL